MSRFIRVCPPSLLQMWVSVAEKSDIIVITTVPRDTSNVAKIHSYSSWRESSHLQRKEDPENEGMEEIVKKKERGEGKGRGDCPVQMKSTVGKKPPLARLIHLMTPSCPPPTLLSPLHPSSPGPFHHLQPHPTLP